MRAEPVARSRRARLDLRAVVLLTFLCLLWGLQQVAIKEALDQGLPPALQAGLRSALSAVCLAVWTGARHGPATVARMFRPDAMLLPGLLMGLIFSVEFLLLYGGMTRTSASRGVLFLYTSPFFVALGVHLFVPAERLGLRQVAGLACAFLGVAIAVLEGLRGARGSLIGDAMITGTAILWASLTVCVRAVPALRRSPPERVLMFQLGISAVVLLVVAAMRGELPALASATWAAYAVMVYQSVVIAFATYLLWYWLMTIYPASKLAAFSFLTPIFGMLAGVVLLHDALSAGLLVAMGFVAAGLYLVNGKTAETTAAG
jgi:drug/metabolite transporter (DMT)-like permease